MATLAIIPAQICWFDFYCAHDTAGIEEIASPGCLHPGRLIYGCLPAGWDLTVFSYVYTPEAWVQ